MGDIPERWRTWALRPLFFKSRSCLAASEAPPPAKVPDTGRVTRLLGLKANCPQRWISYDNAVKICRALDVDPVDVGV